MKGFDLLIAHLKDFKDKRQNLSITFDGNRKEYADAIAGCFIDCARGILAGHFVVTNSLGEAKVTRIIYPSVIELYYHEEENGRFKDPIMYHTNDRKLYDFYKDKYEEYKGRKGRLSYFDKRGINELPYFPFGSLNPHSSGIDITFENPEMRYRASFLIREYYISFDGKEPIRIENSTDLYDDMLLNGITLDNADWIEWIDGDTASITVAPAPRKNVSAYEKYNNAPELWRKVVLGKNENGKYIFKPCEFSWQFRINNANVVPYSNRLLELI